MPTAAFELEQEERNRRNREKLERELLERQEIERRYNAAPTYNPEFHNGESEFFNYQLPLMTLYSIEFVEPDDKDDMRLMMEIL